MDQKSREWSSLALRWILLALALALPLSIAVAEPLAFVAVPVWIVGVVRRKSLREVAATPYFWIIILFVVAALTASVTGPKPAKCLAKCHRLFLLAIPFMMRDAFGSRRDENRRWLDIERAVLFFIAGAGILGLYDLARVPLAVMGGTHLYDTGNMRDPQIYMVALMLLAALWSENRCKDKTWLWLGTTCILGGGLLVHFKRGVWASFLGAAVLTASLGRKWRMLIAAVLCALSLLALPQVRLRLEMLQSEWSVRQGGRYTLWTRVAPTLLKKYPLGMGLCAPDHADLKAASRYVQPRLNHLHNNVLEIGLEVGWAGLGIWLIWMVVTGVLLVRSFRFFAREGDPATWVALGAFGAFCGLMLNGMVEYNFGDSEILMVLCFLMGAAATLWDRRRALLRAKVNA